VEIIIDDATLEDFATFTPHDKNIAEIKAAVNIDFDVIMAALYDASTDKKKVLCGNKIICLIGMVENSIWLYFSSGVDKLPLSFFKASRKFINEMLKKYPLIEGNIYYKNTFSLDWAKFMGFKICEPHLEGLHNEPFYRFYQERS